MIKFLLVKPQSRDTSTAFSAVQLHFDLILTRTYTAALNNSNFSNESKLIYPHDYNCIEVQNNSLEKNWIELLESSSTALP